jgi:hypothetical protein
MGGYVQYRGFRRPERRERKKRKKEIAIPSIDAVE